MRLLTNAAAGNGTAVRIGQPYNREISQLKTLFVYGTPDGSTFTLQISPDETDVIADIVNWFTVPGVTITVLPATLNIEFRAKWVRGVVTGGTAPSVNALLK